MFAYIDVGECTGGISFAINNGLGWAGGGRWRLRGVNSLPSDIAPLIVVVVWVVVENDAGADMDWDMSGRELLLLLLSSLSDPYVDDPDVSESLIAVIAPPQELDRKCRERFFLFVKTPMGTNGFSNVSNIRVIRPTAIVPRLRRTMIF